MKTLGKKECQILNLIKEGKSKSQILLEMDTTLKSLNKCLDVIYKKTRKFKKVVDKHFYL